MIIRHGPHHAAQKSTTTGTDAVVSAVNVPASASTTHGTVDLHRGHRGTPYEIGPTRLRALQVGQPMMVMITRVERGRATVPSHPAISASKRSWTHFRRDSKDVRQAVDRDHERNVVLDALDAPRTDEARDAKGAVAGPSSPAP